MVGRCKTCEKEIKTKNWSLTGLRKHLQCKHSELFQELSGDRAGLNLTESGDENAPEVDASMEELDVSNFEIPPNLKQEKTKMDKIFLKQNDFQTETLNIFKDMLNDPHFTNITLVTEGNRYIRAHKVILSAFSPVFKDILVNTPDCPFIYLRGVQHEHLEAIVNYIYLGETKVSLESVTEFLNVASDLKIVGLGIDQTVERQETETEDHNSTDIKMQSDCSSIEENICSEDNKEVNQPTPIMKLDDDPLTSNDMKYTCDICEYETLKKFNLKEHNESVHEGLKYPCTSCEHLSSSRSNLKKHTARIHKINDS